MKKNIWLGVVAVAVIGICAWWNVKVLTGSSKINASLHRRIGEMLATETVKALEGKGRVVLVTGKAVESEILALQAYAFRSKLAETPGVELTEVIEMESDAKAQYGPGVGLSAGRFMRMVKKHPKADLMVSLVGMPELDAKEIDELGEVGPRFLASSRQMKKWGLLFEQKRLQGAIVPRFQFPSPVKGDPHTPQEWFDLQFQWITAAVKH